MNRVQKSALSIGISIAIYSLLFGPWFGFGFIALLFIHEMGHVIAIRQRGLQGSPPIFIPFLGAVIDIKNLGTRNDESWIGIGGPLLGAIGAAGVLMAGLHFQSRQLIELALFGGMINLFNLCPISPLDGGRVMQIVGGWTTWVGVVLFILCAVVAHQPSLMMVFIFLLGELRIHKVLRFALAVLSLIGMIVLATTSLSVQPFPSVMLYAFLSWIFVSGYYKEMMDPSKPGMPVRDPRPRPPMIARLRWTSMYLAVVFGCMLIISISTQGVPAQTASTFITMAALLTAAKAAVLFLTFLN